MRHIEPHLRLALYRKHPRHFQPNRPALLPIANCECACQPAWASRLRHNRASGHNRSFQLARSGHQARNRAACSSRSRFAPMQSQAGTNPSKAICHVSHGLLLPEPDCPARPRLSLKLRAHRAAAACLRYQESAFLWRWLAQFRARHRSSHCRDHWRAP